MKCYTAWFRRTTSDRLQLHRLYPGESVPFCCIYFISTLFYSTLTLRTMCRSSVGMETSFLFLGSLSYKF